MHATNERFRIFASYRILFLHTFQCGTRYRGCVTNSTRNIVKSTNVLVREKQQGRGGARPFAECCAMKMQIREEYARACVCAYSMRVLAGDIRQTNDTVQNTICSDSQSIENSRR